MIPRLFVDAPLACDERIAADGAQTHYLLRVLRLGAGAALSVFNGRGGEFAAQIVRADKRRLEIAIGAFYPDTPPRLHIHLGQGVFESGKMDWAIEKITELGASSVHPLICRQNAALCRPFRASRGGAPAALDRWRRVAIAACQQCGRNIPPTIAAPQTADEWFAQIPPHAARLLFTPAGGGGAKATLKALAPPSAAPPSAPPAVYALIGPRAGLTAAEEASARAAGFAPVTLGRRILRVETAAVVAVAFLQTIAGDFA